MEPEVICSDSELENLPPPPVTFELQIPDNWDTEADVELLEVMQQDVPGFDEMLVEACQTIETHEMTQEPVNPPQIQNDQNLELPQIQNGQNHETHQNQKQHTVTPKDQNTQDLDTAETPQAEFHQSGHPPNTSRFKQLDEEALLDIEKNQYSAATKKNTKWVIGVFNAWCSERLQKTVDFNTISEENLNESLRKFCAEAWPKYLNKRIQSMPESMAQEYHKNSLKNVRSVINRHLKDIGRNIDIVRDKDFKLENSMLSAKLKFNLRNGLSRSTQHHSIISISELQKINEFLSTKNNDVALRFKVWYALAIHFVSPGIEFHQQLSKDSVKFVKDEEGSEYPTITHETHQKNNQGGVEDSSEEAKDKIVYSTDSNPCPVQAVKLFLSKCHPNSKSLFNQCSRDALRGNPNHYSGWYTEKQVKVKAFTTFMPDICKNAGVNRYTAHSLRSTAITAMSDAGLTDRNIMYMSDHKCEESLKSYCRRPSNEQKQKNQCRS
ncbi:unnamed protein product [Mytilus coruscus]|uniref:Tyr recombinase domain-containing protein n=1 Tax=Mytilus coruscus TaxID=42192 RepID=A0A6J8DYT9_MYTCO|nr:unnamed protein product [Mytilus coruscus]